MKKLIFIILVFSSISLFGQNDSIEKRKLNLEKEKTKLIKSEIINIDSINVKIFVYEDRIETENYFEKSGSKLKVTYSLIGNSFEKIVTRENCPTLPEDFWRTYIFEFRNGNIVEEEERLYSSSKMHGIAGHIANEVNKSYSKTLNSEFLRKYVVELLNKIKNNR
jgi:hypothetical protein